MKRLFYILIKACMLMLLLVLISYVLVFFLPGDPVNRMIAASDPLKNQDPKIKNERYEQLFRQLGFNIPSFYISVSTRAVPDSLHYLPEFADRERLIYWSAFSGDVQLAKQWCVATDAAFYNCLVDSSKREELPFYTELHSAVEANEAEDALQKLHSINQSNFHYLALNKLFFSLNTSSQNNAISKWWPVLNWNPDNRFHRMLFGSPDDQAGGLFSGDLGYSWSRGERVHKVIFFPILLSVGVCVVCVVLIILVSLFLGCFLAMRPEGVLHRMFFSFSLFLYSVPLFWLGILIIIFFCSPYYLAWFPVVPPHLDHSSVSAWFYSVVKQWTHFVLPVLVISAGGIAYFTKMIYELVTDEVRKPYAIAVLARGISFDRLVFRHVLRNIAVPVLVSGFSTFASFIGSSIVMEYLFSIPGSGQLIMQACTEGDYPLVQGVVLFSGIFVLLSFIASDLIALFADPRAAASNGIKQVQG